MNGGSGGCQSGYSGQTITFTYDDFNRLETVREPSGPSSADAATYAYDDLDNVVEATRTYKGLSTKTFEYGYHADGSRETMVNAAGTWTYSYDENGQCVELESPAGTATFSYLDNGWQETRTLPNGSYTEYEWNNLGLPKTLTNRKSDASVRSKFEDFSYDGVFNLTGMDTTSSVYTPFVGPNTWGYDTKDRLTSDAYDQDSANTLDYSDSFAYDDAFNPTTFKGTTHGFDADNRRTSPGTFAYDGNGNPTTYNGVSMSFDLENRLTSTTSGSDAFDAAYRSDGLRAWKAWNMVAPTQEGDPIAVGTYYYYDGGLPVLEVNSSGTVTAINVFAPDGLVSRKQSSNWRHYQFDAQGSVTHRLRDNDTVISNGKYTAYGSRLTVPTFMDDPFGFNGRWGYYTDLGLELILCMHRYYDVATGRWMTRDPIGYPGGIGLYAYCAGGPVGMVDANGLVTISIFGTEYEFTGGSISEGLQTAGFAFADMFWGTIDSSVNSSAAGVISKMMGGPQSDLASMLDKYRNRPGFDASAGAWGVARDAAGAAAGLQFVRCEMGYYGTFDKYRRGGGGFNWRRGPRPREDRVFGVDIHPIEPGGKPLPHIDVDAWDLKHWPWQR